MADRKHPKPPFGLLGLNQADETGGRGRVKGAGGLITDQPIWFLDEGSGNTHPLELPTTHLMGLAREHSGLQSHLDSNGLGFGEAVRSVERVTAQPEGFGDDLT